MATYGRVFIKNIYYMLAYAYRAFDLHEIKSLSSEEFDHIHDLLAALLDQGIGRQLKRGLHREYAVHQEDLTALHGKILLGDTMRHRVTQRRVVSCEFDELSCNITLNQILKTAAITLIRHGEVSKERRTALHKKAAFLNEIDEVDPRSISWPAIRLTPATQNYRLVLAVAYLVLNQMIMTEKEGGDLLSPVIGEKTISTLFEKFLLNFFILECPQVTAHSSHIKWALDDEMDLLLPSMHPDIMLHSGRRTLIIDAKFYTHSALQSFHGTNKIHSDNLYQIFTYVKNHQASRDIPGSVSGMLLYARTDEDLQPDITYNMDGNAITVTTVDLNQDFSGIATYLRSIARSFAASQDEGEDLL